MTILLVDNSTLFIYVGRYCTNTYFVYIKSIYNKLISYIHLIHIFKNESQNKTLLEDITYTQYKRS